MAYYKDDLKNIRGKLNFSREPEYSPMSLGADGEDHININPRGATLMGRALSHESAYPVKHPIFSDFPSMESFWHYIKLTSHPDAVRNLIGGKLREYVKDLDRSYAPNFKAIIMMGSYYKIKGNRELLNLVVKSDLPIDSYYNPNNSEHVRVRFNFANWTIPGMEEVRDALKENKLPDLSFLVETRYKDDADIHDAFLATLKSFSVSPKKKESEKVVLEDADEVEEQPDVGDEVSSSDEHISEHDVV